MGDWSYHPDINVQLLIYIYIRTIASTARDMSEKQIRARVKLRHLSVDAIIHI